MLWICGCRRYPSWLRIRSPRALEERVVDSGQASTSLASEISTPMNTFHHLACEWSNCSYIGLVSANPWSNHRNEVPYEFIYFSRTLFLFKPLFLVSNRRNKKWRLPIPHRLIIVTHFSARYPIPRSTNLDACTSDNIMSNSVVYSTSSNGLLHTLTYMILLVLLAFVVLPSYLVSPSDMLARAKDVVMGEGFACAVLTLPFAVV